MVTLICVCRILEDANSQTDQGVWEIYDWWGVEGGWQNIVSLEALTQKICENQTLNDEFLKGFSKYLLNNENLVNYCNI